MTPWSAWISADPARDLQGQRAGSVFPLPLVAEEPVAGSGRRSPSVRSSINRRVNETVRSINWCVCAAVAGQGSLLPLHEDLLTIITTLVKSRVTDGQKITPAEANRVLLKGRCAYDGGGAATSLASYSEGRVSLPESVHNAPFVHDLVCSADRVILEDFEQCMLRDDAEFRKMLKEGRGNRYVDPVLAGSRRKYGRFIRNLDGRGLLYFTRQPIEFVVFSLCIRKTINYA